MLFSYIRVPVLSGKGYDRVKVKGGKLCLYYRVEPKMVNGVRTYKKKNLGQIVTDDKGSELLMPNENYYEHMQLPLPEVDASRMLRPGRGRAENNVARARLKILTPKFRSGSVGDGLSASGLTIAAMHSAEKSGLIDSIYAALGEKQGSTAFAAAIFAFTPMLGGMEVIDEFSFFNSALTSDGFSRYSLEALLSSGADLNQSDIFMSLCGPAQMSCKWDVFCLDFDGRTAVVCTHDDHVPMMYACGTESCSFESMYEQAIEQADVRNKAVSYVVDAGQDDSFEKFLRLQSDYKSHRCMRFVPDREPEIIGYLARWAESGFKDSAICMSSLDVTRTHREQVARLDQILYLHMHHSMKAAAAGQLQLAVSIPGVYTGNEAQSMAFRLASCGCSAAATSGTRMESEEVFELFSHKDKLVRQLSMCHDRLLSGIRIPADPQVLTGVRILSFIALHILNSMRIDLSDAMETQGLSFEGALQRLNSLRLKRNGNSWTSADDISPSKAVLLNSMGIKLSSRLDD